MINFDNFKEGCPWRGLDLERNTVCKGQFKNARRVETGASSRKVLVFDRCTKENCAPLFWVNSKR